MVMNTVGLGALTGAGSVGESLDLKEGKDKLSSCRNAEFGQGQAGWGPGVPPSSATSLGIRGGAPWVGSQLHGGPG